MKTFFVLFIACVFSLGKVEKIYAQDETYIELQKLKNVAFENYYIGNLTRAKTELKKLIKKDINNYFWESYLYLGEIYKAEGKVDSANFIIQEALSENSVVWQAKNEYKSFLFELTGDEDYADSLDAIISGLHIFPDVRPLPVVGWDKLKNNIRAYFTRNFNAMKLYFDVIITKKGTLARIEVSKKKCNKKLIVSDKFYEYIFSVKWKPAQYKSQKIDIAISFSIII